MPSRNDIGDINGLQGSPPRRRGNQRAQNRLGVLLRLLIARIHGKPKAGHNIMKTVRSAYCRVGGGAVALGQNLNFYMILSLLSAKRRVPEQAAD